MKQLIKGYTNQQILEHCEEDGIDYFFLSHVDIGAIEDYSLRQAAIKFVAAYNEIDDILSRIEDEDEEE